MAVGITSLGGGTLARSRVGHVDAIVDPNESLAARRDAAVPPCRERGCRHRGIGGEISRPSRRSRSEYHAAEGAWQL